MNPLQSSPMQAGSPLSALAPAPIQQPPANPLAPTPVAPPDTHAQMGQGIAALNLPPEDLAKEAKLASYASAAFSKLAKNPNIKPRDIIKVASEAVSEGLETPSKAIAFLTQIPSDDKKLHSWVVDRAASFMTNAVHLKAQMIRSAQLAPVAPAAPMSAPGVPIPAGVPQ